MKSKSRSKRNILHFSEIGIKDVPLVGGKNASLGEMYRNLKTKGVPVPNGFAVTAWAYRSFLRANNLDKKINEALVGLNTKNTRSISAKGEKIRSLILNAEIPKDMADEIYEAYLALSKSELPPAPSLPRRQAGLPKRGSKRELDVAVRSSATAEDLPGASFAGQQETYLNIRGRAELIESVKKCFSSLFTDRAISYRADQGFDQTKIYLSVAVQKMVRSDVGASGVMFSLDTDSGFRDTVLINSAYGLGENVVKGVVNPDEFMLFKPLLGKVKNSVVSKNLGTKKLKMIYSSPSPSNSPFLHSGGQAGRGRSTGSTKNINVTRVDQEKFSITDKQAEQLAKWAVIIENYYKKPMDMEWAYDGKTKKFYIVQARPETIHAQKNPYSYEEYIVEKPKISSIRKGQAGKIIIEGVAVGSKLGIGRARVIMDASKIHEFRPGEVLVTEITDPDWEPIMKIASAIVTNSGGRTSHAAIVSREIGIPAVVGTGEATKKIKSGKEITVSCAEGEVGRVYEGKIKYTIRKVNLKNFQKPKTKVMMNVGDPVAAFDFAQVPNSGVGLAREEFIINDYIKVHPLALINFAKLKDPGRRARLSTGQAKERINTVRKIEELTVGYKDKKKFFVDKLAYGVARIAAAYHPNDVILRFSDFKTNEYATLLGGKDYEPVESNPMIGWRGASRYYDPKFKEAFGLECAAIKKVREEMGLTNLKVMVPFCRTPDEGKKVLAVMREFGLERGKKGLDVYVMAEIPSNVIDAENFAKIFDGFSIGSNDLTQLALGVDRDSDLVAHIYDERTKTVKDLISTLIKTAHKYKRKVGICGQGPSDHPDFAQFLVREGIDSISLNPDSVLQTTLKINEMEKKMRR
ncbi:MAG: phosphoenolpyruvate synthase [Candidatus Doudnabacteria bacterium RIFCSPHIGHO2_01_FULL_43_23]|uniref:Phosphoenolpyruvate synthase n=1 Tax=Candidatus Doudnabacteria bacterium RIFCSPHIGHO2_01_FULL_43_23 TaxID=1817822 RepID=A0A1F5NV47_9BACT|nr:MAG: phosphoenolpyruvate synthase [Candidatus Doudnabacteria bacterium RIFCSPHIGHO2_01_FULL_43_23]